MIDRYEISSYLNQAMMGFMEGSTDGLAGMVADNLKRRFGIDVPRSNVRVIIDKLANPDRMCWSIHVEHDGQHYESVIVNLRYDTGYEL
jgi:hypothetical protein